MHRLLKRQIKRSFGKDFDLSTLPQNTQEFINAVNESYKTADDEKVFLERTLDISSEEITLINHDLKLEKIKFQKEAQKSENFLQQYKEITDKSAIITIIDPQGIVTYANDIFCKISEQSIDELISSKYNLISHYIQNKELRNNLWPIIRDKKEIWQGEIEFVSKSGKKYYLKSTIKSILNTHGEILEFIVLQHDITDIYLAAKEKELFLLLEKQRAEQANQIKGDFLANMSHEIRTPLNAILGFIDLLKEKEQDEESHNYLDTIDSSSYTLLAIINDILDFSKIESGKLAIDFIAFNPVKEFNTLADLFKARCSEKNLSFKIEISEQLPSGLQTDILRLKQIITNLLSNAIKFTHPDKTISLIIDYSQGYLNCSVKDEGIGMTSGAQKHIFEAFSQAETSTTRKFGGTGLGLAISSRLVKILGGRLKVESELNTGSHFYFSIPAQPVDWIDDESVQPDFKQSFQGHILLVEDNNVNQMLMSALLKKNNLTFNIAEDGLEALSAFQSNSYDLILMDENMPNLNGIAATKKIRALEQEEGRVRTPIVALTANAMAGDRERFMQSGMDEYLSKPVNQPKLLEVFANFLTSDLIP